MKRTILVSLVLIFSVMLNGEQPRMIDQSKAMPAYRVDKAEGESVVNAAAKSKSPDYNPVVNAVKVDSSHNGYGMVVGLTNPLTHFNMGSEDENYFVMAYRQFQGMEASAGHIGAAVSVDNGETWTGYSGLNSNAPGAIQGRYPSAIGGEGYPYIIWNEYAGGGGTYEGRALYAYDALGWAGGFFTDPVDINTTVGNPEDMWVGIPDYSYDATAGAGYLNVVFTSWTNRNKYLFHSLGIGDDGAVSFTRANKIFDVETHFQGTADENYTSDAGIGINADGVGYVACTAYWAEEVNGSTYHTFMIRKTEDYGATWSTSGTNGMPYYYIPDNVLDDAILDTYIPSSVDLEDGSVLEFEGLFIGYDNEVAVDADGGLHLMALIVPSAGDGVYPTIVEGCGFYHFYSPDPTDANSWQVTFVQSMQETWLYYYLNSDRSWQSFAPVMATSVTDGNIIYAAHGVAIVDSVINSGDTTVYMNYDILLHRSNDAGANWETPINVTQTPDYMEVGVHLDPDAFDDRVYLAYQVPSEIETIDPIEVWEDYMMWVYFMNAEWDPSINPVSVEERMPTDYALNQNYPNPFNPVTTINYTVPTSEMVSLKVFNTAGQLVATLADGVAEAGTHSVQFDGSHLASGVYFYQLSGASVNLTQKMVLMK
jgi:hypothetical protein